jgi:hypothetical protein
MTQQSETTTRQTITVTLSTDSYYGEGWDEGGPTKADLDRADENITLHTVQAAYPDAEVEVNRAGIMTVKVVVETGGRYDDETSGEVALLVDRRPSACEMEEEEIMRWASGAALEEGLESGLVVVDGGYKSGFFATIEEAREDAQKCVDDEGYSGRVAIHEARTDEKGYLQIGKEVEEYDCQDPVMR